MATVTKQQREQARQALTELLAGESPRVYTSLKSVSSSGMTRHISCHVISDGRLLNISYLVGELLGWGVTDKLGARCVRVSGCGMDMGFHIVYSLSATLNGYEDRGGYKIRHEWM